MHFNDPGRASWEGVETGSAALAAGGGTCFIDMPLNSSPPTLDAPSFAAKLSACRGAARTDFALWGGLTPDNLEHLEALAECGVVGFKAFMAGSGISDFRCCDDAALYRGMRIAARLGLPVAVHAENDAMVGVLAAEARAAGRTAVRDFLSSRPVAAEAEAISRAIAFAGETGCKLHVVHTSSARGARLIHAAAASGACDVTCETCPHYLLLSESDVERLGARAKCAPPLRPDSERDQLVALVAEGLVDTIGSDHSPAPPAMKQSDDFFGAWGGISGVQSTLRVLLTLPVPLPLLSRLVSDNVARRFGLPGKGGLRVGADADCVLVDLSDAPILQADELFDRHRLSPYVGRALRGRVTADLAARSDRLPGRRPGGRAAWAIHPARAKMRDPSMKKKEPAAVGYAVSPSPSTAPPLPWTMRRLRRRFSTSCARTATPGASRAAPKGTAEPARWPSWNARPPGRPTYRAINSCIALLPMFAGREIVTVEGLATGDSLHPVQAHMVEQYGSQCGYCTPGFVMSLFEAYYREDCREAWQLSDQLSGNLCRCTGYRPIRDAALGALGAARICDTR